MTAENVITAHTDDDEQYAVDFTDRLPTGVTVSSATITQAADDPDAEDLTVGAAVPNAATFTNHRGDTVAIGKGVLFNVTGGTADTDYALTVAATCSDTSVRVCVCTLRVKA